MSGWRFYPLAEHLRFGLLVNNNKAVPARFFTLEEAKASRARKLTDQREAGAA